MPTFVGQKHRPPLTEAETTVDAFAHCPDPRCPGNAQVRVKAVKTVTEASYAALDGEWPFTQNTWERYRVADQADELCGDCGRTREVTHQERPEYQKTWGAQDFLLHAAKFDPNKRNTEADERQAAEMAEMRRMMVAQAEQIAALTAKATRGPGRPSKDA